MKHTHEGNPHRSWYVWLEIGLRGLEGPTREPSFCKKLWAARPFTILQTNNWEVRWKRTRAWRGIGPAWVAALREDRCCPSDTLDTLYQRCLSQWPPELWLGVLGPPDEAGEDTSHTALCCLLYDSPEEANMGGSLWKPWDFTSGKGTGPSQNPRQRNSEPQEQIRLDHFTSVCLISGLSPPPPPFSARAMK